LNLGKKLISLSDPNLALATRQWSICSIANICLIISETDSTALIWWRLFFYRYFAFIAAGTGSNAGMNMSDAWLELIDRTIEVTDAFFFKKSSRFEFRFSFYFLF
jgi:hypothetical protein